MLNRVAITGLGSICGLGNNTPEVWSNAIAGKSGIRTVENTDVSDLPVKIAGEVKKFSPNRNYILEKEQSYYDKFITYALEASIEAMHMSGLLEEQPYDKDRMGCIIGVGMGGFNVIEHNFTQYKDKGPRRVSPFLIPGIIPNLAPGIVSIKLGLMGVNYATSSACASSGHALSAAFSEIAYGNHDLIISGGSESTLSKLPYLGFANMKALSRNNENPQQASRPFDIDRNGFVMGEGSGILILENLEKAKARGANILAELVGHGTSSDANHITAPREDGKGASLCMKKAVSSANIHLEDIDYINAHGTSTPLGDIAETNAVKDCFKNHAKHLSISSTKSMTGHLLGAAGGIESVFCVLSLKEQIIPPTINLINQDEKCDLNYTANKAIKKDFQYALNNSFGFGGTNSSLIFKKY